MEYGQPPCRAVVRHSPKLPCSYYAAPPRGVQPDPENPGPVTRPAASASDARHGRVPGAAGHAALQRRRPGGAAAGRETVPRNGTLLSRRGQQRGLRVVDHGAVDDVGEAPLEAAPGFFVGLSGCSFALAVFAAGGRSLDLGHGHDMQRVVQLPSPARDRRYRWMSPEDTSIGAAPQYEAKADSDRNLPTAPERARIFAARTSPMPCNSAGRAGLPPGPPGRPAARAVVIEHASRRAAA